MAFVRAEAADDFGAFDAAGETDGFGAFEDERAVAEPEAADDFGAFGDEPDAATETPTPTRRLMNPSLQRQLGP